MSELLPPERSEQASQPSTLDSRPSTPSLEAQGNAARLLREMESTARQIAQLKGRIEALDEQLQRQLTACTYDARLLLNDRRAAIETALIETFFPTVINTSSTQPELPIA